MHTPWIGSRKIAIIPAVVNDPKFNPPPANWVDLIRQRIFYDPDPATGVDRSLRAYIHTISYGRALLEADIYDPVTVPWSHCGATQDAAIQATPAAHAYEYACVVFTAGTHGCNGWAFYDNPPFPFSPPPPSGTNNLRNWCYVSMGASLGVWSMEIMHAMTAFGDLYNTIPHPGNFDNMACNCGTHPSTFTKLKLGWLNPSLVHTATDVNWDSIGHANQVVAMTAINNKLFAATSDNKLWWRDPVGTNVDWVEIGHANYVVAMAAINNKLFAATSDNKLWWRDPVGHGGTFTLHALALLQPPPPGRVTAVRISSGISQRYFLVEARLRIDSYEKATPGISSGIPSEGVVVYEIDEAVWPVQLRTPNALSLGQKYSNPAEKLEIEVTSSVPGGFTVAIRSV